MIITAGALLFSGVVGFVSYVIEVFSSGLTIPSMIGVFGFGLMVFSMLILMGIWLYQLMVYVWKKMIVWFSKLVFKRGEK
jgi:uncharacterized membrane protein